MYVISPCYVTSWSSLLTLYIRTDMYIASEQIPLFSADFSRQQQHKVILLAPLCGYSPGLARADTQALARLSFLYCCCCSHGTVSAQRMHCAKASCKLSAAAEAARQLALAAFWIKAAATVSV